MPYLITADYHTHTRYSHGKGTIEENVQVARAKGLEKVAITDHGFNHVGFGLSFNYIDSIRNEIDDINRRYKDIEVLFGIEANLIGMNGEIDIPEQYLDTFDIILMGFHRAVKPFSFRDGWELFFKNALYPVMSLAEQKRIRHANTIAMIRAIERYPIHTIVHPGAKIDMDTKLLAKYATQHNVFMEINSSHGFMTVEYAKIAMEEGAFIVINSDAHTPNRVGDMSRGIGIAQAAGIPSHRILNTKDFLL